MEVQKFVVEKIVRKFFRVPVMHRLEPRVPFRSPVHPLDRIAVLSDPKAKFRRVRT